MKTKILIVEDESIIALNIKEILTDFGYIVVGIASNSEKALHLVRTKMPDLILMDITLQNREHKYVHENEVYIIGSIKEAYKEAPPIRIPEKTKTEKPNIQLSYKEVPILPEGCCSCRYRSECVRKAHAKGRCNEYKRGPAVLCYSDLTEQV